MDKNLILKFKTTRKDKTSRIGYMSFCDNTVFGKDYIIYDNEW